MAFLSPKYVVPAPDVARAPAIEDGAGIYLLGGRWHFAVPAGPEAHALVAAGALRIGTLRFDPDPTERRHEGRAVGESPADRAASLSAATRN